MFKKQNDNRPWAGRGVNALEAGGQYNTFWVKTVQFEKDGGSSRPAHMMAPPLESTIIAEWISD